MEISKKKQLLLKQVTIWEKCERGQPTAHGEYLVYMAETDCIRVSYWDGIMWGFKGKVDDLVSHWAPLPETPMD